MMKDFGRIFLISAVLVGQCVLSHGGSSEESKSGSGSAESKHGSDESGRGSGEVDYDAPSDPACKGCKFTVIHSSGRYASESTTRCRTYPADYVYITVLSNYKANWFKANEDCERKGMRLKTFLSVVEQRQIGAEIVVSDCVIGPRDNGSVWTGHNVVERLMRPGQVDAEAWTGTSGRPLIESMWDTSRGPNPSRSLVRGCGGFTFESCVEMIITTSPKTSATFNDADCFLEKFFVCEKVYRLSTPAFYKP